MLNWPEQSNFGRGVLTPKLHARDDLDHYRAAVKEANNAIVSRHSGIYKRSGTQFVLESRVTSGADEPRLLEFNFDADQAYAIEMSYVAGQGGKFRFFARGGVVQSSPGVVYEVPHIYSAAQINELDWAQSFDTVYFAHKDVFPQKLVRNSETNWSFAPLYIKDGPYELLNATAYRYQATGVSVAPPANLAAIVGGTSAWNFNFENISSVNGGLGFTAADIGRHISGLTGRSKDAAGAIVYTWEWGIIYAINNSLSVCVATNFSLLYDTFVTSWRLGSWTTSQGLGYPSRVAFYLERSAWAGSPGHRSTIWLSENGITDSMQSLPAADTNALQLDITGATKIEWMIEADDLLYGTPQEARAIGAADHSSAISSTNLSHRKGQHTGARKDVKPIRAGINTLYASLYGKALREMSYNFQVDSYKAPEATILSDHLLTGVIQQMVVLREPDQIIYMRLADGSLVMMAYEPDQQLVALAPASIAGSKAQVAAGGEGVVVSMAGVQGNGHSDLWVIVKRTINGQTKRYVEMLQPAFNVNDLTLTAADAWCADSAIYYSGVAASTFTGFNHLIGETLAVMTNKGVHPPVVVAANGSITLNFPATKVLAGLGYPFHIRTLPIPKQQDGTLQTRRRKAFQVIVDFLRSASVAVKQVDGIKSETIIRRKASDAMDAPVPLFTGPQAGKLESSWDKAGEIQIDTDRFSPVPVYIRSITPAYDAEP